MDPIINLAIAICVGLGAGGAAIGIGIIGNALVNAIGRNPEASSKVLIYAILAITLTEVMAIYSLVMGFLIRSWQ